MMRGLMSRGGRGQGWGVGGYKGGPPGKMKAAKGDHWGGAKAAKGGPKDFGPMVQMDPKDFGG